MVYKAAWIDSYINRSFAWLNYSWTWFVLELGFYNLYDTDMLGSDDSSVTFLEGFF